MVEDELLLDLPYMAVIKEYKVSEHLSLKMQFTEDGKCTFIYVDDDLVNICSFILVSPTEHSDNLASMDSIDDLENYLDKSNEYNKMPGDMEFFAHCSNLQAWHEHGYDTRLLHRNLAFPLLKKLTEAGDSQAQKVFKEEIGKRLFSGSENVATYLCKEKYIILLSDSELELLSQEASDQVKNALENVILKLLPDIGTKKKLKDKLYKFLSYLNPETHANLKFVEVRGERFFLDGPKLVIRGRKKEKITKISEIKNLTEHVHLRKLSITFQELSDLEGLETLSKLTSLNLTRNEIDDLRVIGKLKNLEKLKLGGNKLESLDGIETLTRLKKLYIRDNKLKNIDAMKKLKNLERIVSINNPIDSDENAPHQKYCIRNWS